MKPFYILFILALSLVLAACGSNSVMVTNPPEVQPTLASPTRTLIPPTDISEVQPTQAAGPIENQLPELTDSQGAVTVIVTLLNLGDQENELKFGVALETHSVDLSMDLASLATLTTDTGLTVQAILWDAPRGGHHVSGTLSFPSSVDGKAILDDASTLTLLIKDVDAPERTFVWDLK
jgi:hypothetical protein